MEEKIAKRKRRARRVRARIHGTAQKPRLNVFRSNRHIYAQLIDDDAGKVLAAANSLQLLKDKKKEALGTKVMIAKLVGEMIAKKALQKGIQTVVFDRGPYKYHGRVKALAESARQAGLKF